MKPSVGRLLCGFSLLEVMIAVAVFSTGLGGLSLLLMLAIQETSVAGLKTVAVSQARSISENLQLLPDVAIQGIVPADTPACLKGGNCAPGQMAGAALFAWQRQIAVQIPGGRGIVCLDSTPDDGDRGNPSCDGAGGEVVKVFWPEPGKHDGQMMSERRVVVRMPLR